VFLTFSSLPFNNLYIACYLCYVIYVNLYIACYLCYATYMLPSSGLTTGTLINPNMHKKDS